MRVTSKGQVTIPIKIRELAGIEPNSEVEVEYVDGVVVLRRKTGPSRSPGQCLVARLRGSGTALKGMRTDQIMAMTRGDN